MEHKIEHIIVFLERNTFNVTFRPPAFARIVISFAASDQHAVEEIAAGHAAPFAILGRVGGSELKISVNGNEAWRGALFSHGLNG